MITGQSRVEQGVFRVFWVSEKFNLTDYFTKYHSPATHKRLRPIYTYTPDKSPTTLQECIEIITDTDRPSLCTDSNSKNNKPATTTTAKQNHTNNPIYINTCLFKLTNALQDRMLGRLVQTHKLFRTTFTTLNNSLLLANLVLNALTDIIILKYTLYKSLDFKNLITFIVIQLLQSLCPLSWGGSIILMSKWCYQPCGIILFRLYVKLFIIGNMTLRIEQTPNQYISCIK